MNVKWLLLAVIFITFPYLVRECSALPLPVGIKYRYSSSAYLTQDEYWFSQRLDHYSPTDHRQFNQRYYEFLDYFQAPDGPIFLKVCGEYSCDGITNDYMAVLAKKFGAAIVSLEHRYYGKSSPFKELTTHNLQYLSSKQALFDLAMFRNYYQELTNKKQNLSNYENSWFVFGVSYPGALSAWFRLKFPHLTCGSLASSAVVLAIYNFTDFDRQIGESAGPACKKALQEVTRLAEEGLSTSANAVKSLFGAEKLNNDGDFLYLLADAAVTAFQYGNPDVLCSPLVKANSSGQDLMVVYADYVKNYISDGSVESYGQQFLKKTTIEADSNDVTSSRLWWYQVCTEFAYFQVSPSNDSIRSSKVDTKYHLDLCENVFGKDVYPEVDITNVYYGGTSIADIWWRSYGARAPNLQKLAIRILSQTCSSSGCERNWSVFEKIHAKKRNRLEFARLNDLVYVHYNIRLRVRQIESPVDPDAISLDNIDVLSPWRVESQEPILEESPSWLEEPVADDPLEQGQQEEDSESEEQQHLEEEQEELEEDTAGASASTPSAIDIGEHSSMPITHYLTLGAEAVSGPSTTRGRPDKQPIMFSRKRGRGQ